MRNRITLRCLFFVILLFCFEANALVILQYHHVSDEAPKLTSISPKLFKKHMAYLSDNNFKVIAMDKVIASLRNGTALPARSVVITFDDGYRSIFDVAFPILKEKKFPFTVFINTQPIKRELKQFMSWQELQELTRHQGIIANHSVTHAHLIRRLASESNENWLHRIMQEIQTAQSDLEKQLGMTIKAFAYPFGEYNKSLRTILKKLSFVAFGQHSGAVSNLVDLQAIPRYPLGGRFGEMDDFIVKVNSLSLPIIEVRLLDENDSEIADHVLSVLITRPKLKISLEAHFADLNVQCYLSGQGRLNKIRIGSRLVFQPDGDLPVGRSRFNCTALSEIKQQFYWFSQPWIRRNSDGSWYQE